MPNMSYCRFRNTLKDLQDCQNALFDNDVLSPEEGKAAHELIAMCREIADEGIEVHIEKEEENAQ